MARLTPRQGQSISCSITARVAATFSASPGRSGLITPRAPTATPDEQGFIKNRHPINHLGDCFDIYFSCSRKQSAWERIKSLLYPFYKFFYTFWNHPFYNIDKCQVFRNISFKGCHFEIFPIKMSIGISISKVPRL